MELKYSVVRFTINFGQGIYFRNQPHFQLRGILGANLKKIACFQSNQNCRDCFLKENCAYSWLYETYIPKDNSVLKGRDRGSHPFFIRSVNRRKDTEIFDIDTVLIGKAMDYIPYIFAAFEKAGRDGILRERHKFSIDSVVCNGREILSNGNLMEPPKPEELYVQSEKSSEKIDNDISIKLITPLRMKRKGEIVENPGIADIFHASVNRLGILCRMFGKCEDGMEEPGYTIKNEEKELFWSDSEYFSSRQKKKIILGGFKGDINANVKADTRFYEIIKYASVFNIGKNVSFGLGKFEMG